MKILIIGANGRTGQEVLKHGLQSKYKVKAYVRRPETMIPQKNLEIVAGTLDDLETLTAALQGVDAVLMTLGNAMSMRNDKLFEWAVPNIITAMKNANVKRIVSLSALGVGNTFANTTYPYRFGVMTFLRKNFEDHLAGEIKFKDSGLNWTTIHPGPLFNNDKMPRPLVRDAASGYRMPRTPRTNRADVAQVMLDALKNSSTYGKELVMASVSDQ